MSSAAAAMPSKKRAASDVPAVACPSSKKTVKDVTFSAGGALAGVPGWQYPPLPMGMIPPMPYCMPGNPFFPFGMGMFPPFWLPAAAMAAATLPALAAANATVAATMPGVACMSTPQPAASMWPAALLSCAGSVQPAQQQAAAVLAPARASSGVSSAVAFPSTSCTHSVPTAGAVQSSPPSPPPLAASPGSVCNGGQQQPEDDEFANFIDSILLDGDQDVLLRCGDGVDFAHQLPASKLAALQAGDLLSSGGSNCSEGTTDEDPSLTWSESHSLLSLLGPDIGLSDL